MNLSVTYGPGAAEQGIVATGDLHCRFPILRFQSYLLLNNRSRIIYLERQFDLPIADRQSEVGNEISAQTGQ